MDCALELEGVFMFMSSSSGKKISLWHFPNLTGVSTESASLAKCVHTYIEFDSCVFLDLVPAYRSEDKLNEDSWTEQ